MLTANCGKHRAYPHSTPFSVPVCLFGDKQKANISGKSMLWAEIGAPEPPPGAELHARCLSPHPKVFSPFVPLRNREVFLKWPQDERRGILSCDREASDGLRHFRRLCAVRG